MLIQLDDPLPVVNRLASDKLRGFAIRNFCERGGEPGPVKVLTDDPADPAVLAAHDGTNFMIHGPQHRLLSVMTDLFQGNVKQEGGWPDEAMLKEWEEHWKGKRGIFLNTAPYGAWRAACLAGFEPNAEDTKGQVAYIWYWMDQPDLSAQVKHPCRAVAQGLELYELMKQAVHYDETGEYTKLCLENGPSFVLEVDGEAKCWSCMHLNGTMGMIYTPEEHRRKGYARSLAAFQTEYVYAHHGFACCHIIDYNIPSMKMVANLGAECLEEPCVWRVVNWPEETAAEE